METGWLIEGEGHIYLTISQKYELRKPEWFSEHEIALRFARKEDAESFLIAYPEYNTVLGLPVKVVEHLWG